jgi:hypothetical protein
MTPTRRIRFRTARLLDAHAALAKLTTPSLLPAIHPLITRVEEQPVQTSGSVRSWDFTVHEDVPMLGGLVKWPNTYRGRVRLDATRPELARLSGWSSPGVRVENQYTVRGGAIEQLAWLSAPWWVDPFVERTFIEAHRRLLDAASR